MPPNTKTDKLPITECATLFKDEPRGSDITRPTLIQNGNPSAFVSLRREEGQTNPNPSVNTTHKYSYELDRYKKNAMLIFHYDDVYDGSRQTADKVKSTFEKFRFEVEMHHNINGEEVRTISEVFFQRDFSQYGAVGIVVIGKVDLEGMFTTSGAKFVDKDILSHMSTANLNNKPKFIIFESDKAPKRHMPRAFVDINVMDYNFLKSDHIPGIPYVFSNPLRLLCDKVDRLGDKQTLDQIFYNFLHETYNTNSSCPPSINFPPLISRGYTNLPKRLNLWRNA